LLWRQASCLPWSRASCPAENGAMEKTPASHAVGTTKLTDGHPPNCAYPGGVRRPSAALAHPRRNLPINSRATVVCLPPTHEWLRPA
jgi:hypothetical protein